MTDEDTLRAMYCNLCDASINKNAAAIRDSGLCLEEYLNKVG